MMHQERKPLKQPYNVWKDSKNLTVSAFDRVRVKSKAKYFGERGPKNRRGKALYGAAEQLSKEKRSHFECAPRAKV
jgi:hypothetical protein